MKRVYPDERGKATINNHKFEWRFKRSKGESIFGIKGSRIFELDLNKDGALVGSYEKGWSKRIPDDDSDSKLCLDHIIATYGKEKRKEKKD